MQPPALHPPYPAPPAIQPGILQPCSLLPQPLQPGKKKPRRRKPTRTQEGSVKKKLKTANESRSEACPAPKTDRSAILIQASCIIPACVPACAQPALPNLTTQPSLLQPACPNQASPNLSQPASQPQPAPVNQPQLVPASIPWSWWAWAWRSQC